MGGSLQGGAGARERSSKMDRRPKQQGSGPSPSVLSGPAHVAASRDVQNATAGGAFVNQELIKASVQETPKPPGAVSITPTPSPVSPAAIMRSPDGMTHVRHGTGSVQASSHNHRLKDFDVREGIGRSSRHPVRPDQVDAILTPIKSKRRDVIMQLDQGGLRCEDPEDVYFIQEQSTLLKTLPYIRVHESW